MLEVSALRKSYGSTVAVDDVSFQIERGVCFGLLGPNGAGKTTTISIVAGTLDTDSGTVSMDGVAMVSGPNSAKSRIGYVPQELAIYPDLTANQNLAFFGALYGLFGERLKGAAQRVLELVGLADRANEPVKNYSGGMKRRLNIAIGLLHDPELLILDEPTVGVDPQSRNAIFDCLEGIVSQGKTILYTTHYMEEVERLCPWVAIMDRGRIVANGKLADLKSESGMGSLEQVFLELTGRSLRD